MSKFLKLVKENRPGEDKYTVELKDVNGELIDSFPMFGTGSPFDNFNTFKREFGPPIPVEDAEIVSGESEYNINTEVERLAGKAVEDRKRKGDQLVAQYVGDTNKIS